MNAPTVRPLNIALVGATGNIGSRIMDEALVRGHAVTGIARNTQRLPARPRLTLKSVAAGAGPDLAAALAGHDLAIVSVKWTDNAADDIIAAVRASGLKRVIFVVGAGSLRMPDGRTWYEHNLERGTAPPSSGPALAAYEAIRRIADLDWTAVSPAATIRPGERTGRFRSGLDELIADERGESRISNEDFAVAVIDEAERAQHGRRRFTVAY